MAYLLDTNVFIEAKNRHYGFDICPGFWNWIDLEFAAGRVLSVEAVRDELLAREDDLAAWARSKPARFFMRPDATTLPPLATLAVWVRQQKYRSGAITEFLDSADYRLVAHAMAGGHVIVTHEVPSDAVKKVKIPEPAIAHGVQFISPFVMLRRSGSKFVLSAS